VVFDARMWIHVYSGTMLKAKFLILNSAGPTPPQPTPCNAPLDCTSLIPHTYSM
jgi:hypothetical protein